MKAKKYLVAIAITLTLSSCDFNTSVTLASGTIQNPFLEEPLINSAKKYEKALDTSNSIVEILSENDSSLVYRNHFSKRLKTTVDHDTFVELLEGVAKINGEMQEFKPMQWKFQTVNLKTGKHLISTKYVQHEKNMTKVDIIFALNSNYLKIEGLSINPIRTESYASILETD